MLTLFWFFSQHSSSFLCPSTHIFTSRLCCIHFVIPFGVFFAGALSSMEVKASGCITHWVPHVSLALFWSGMDTVTLACVRSFVPSSECYVPRSSENNTLTNTTTLSDLRNVSSHDAFNSLSTSICCRSVVKCASEYVCV